MIGATAAADPGASACRLSSSASAAATASRENVEVDDDERRARRSSTECDVEPRCFVFLFFSLVLFVCEGKEDVRKSSKKHKEESDEGNSLSLYLLKQQLPHCDRDRGDLSLRQARSGSG